MEWTTIITEVIKWLALLVISAVGTAATAWIKTRKEREVNEATDESRRAMLSEAEQAIETAVAYVQQTITNGIKGTEKWTDAAQAEAKDIAIEKFESIMGESGMNLLSNALENVQEWVETKVEAAVLNRKTAKTTGTNITIVETGASSVAEEEIKEENALPETDSIQPSGTESETETESDWKPCAV